MTKEDLVHIVGKSIDFIVNKEWKLDLIFYIVFTLFIIGLTLLILTPIKALMSL